MPRLPVRVPILILRACSLYGVTFAQLLFYLCNYPQDGLLFKSFVRLRPASRIALC